jgi:hypothetical protein
MPVKIVTLVQLFLFAVSLGLFVMAALTFTRRRQAPQSGLLVLAMCAEAFYCFGYASSAAPSSAEARASLSRHIHAQRPATRARRRT